MLKEWKRLLSLIWGAGCLLVLTGDKYLHIYIRVIYIDITVSMRHCCSE
jgi:hypothetical protein